MITEQFYVNVHSVDLECDSNFYWYYYNIFKFISMYNSLYIMSCAMRILLAVTLL